MSYGVRERVPGNRRPTPQGPHSNIKLLVLYLPPVGDTIGTAHVGTQNQRRNPPPTPGSHFLFVKGSVRIVKMIRFSHGRASFQYNFLMLDIYR